MDTTVYMARTKRKYMNTRFRRGKVMGQKSLVRPRRRWEEDNKIHHKEIG
jgi:hypothetical protein